MAPAPQVTSIVGTPTPIPQGGGSNNNTSDILSLAALVLGAGAFVIAFLQMIFQYYTSDLRDKCSSGAIGRWHFHVRTEFDIRDWRPRVLYPEVDLDIFNALKARKKEDEKVLKLFARLRKRGYKWVNIAGGKHGTRLWFVERAGWVLKREQDINSEAEDQEGDGIGDLEKLLEDDDSKPMVKKDRTVRVYQLPFREKIEWLRHLVSHPRHNRIATRTSWANMLECLDVDPKSLVMRRQQADIIPSTMDGPLQTTTLTNIGLWCFVFGMKEVNIDYSEGTIEGRNKYARITTTDQNVPGISNVISLEGDLIGLERMVDEATTPELKQVAYYARGSLNFISFRVPMQSAEPLLIVLALQDGWTKRKYREATLRRLKESGNLVWEAQAFKQLKFVPADTREWKDFWDSRNGAACPSLIQLLAFLPFHTICSGYPHKLVLSPYEKVLDGELGWRRFWNDDKTQLLCSEWEDRNLLENGYLFVRPHKSFLLMTVEGRNGQKDGAHSWIFAPVDDYKQVIEDNEKVGWKGIESDVRRKLESLVEVCEYYNLRAQFPIHPLVFRLLEGESLESIRTEIQALMAVEAPIVSVEVALWFTLFTLDSRIEDLWGTIDVGQDGDGDDAEETDFEEESEDGGNAYWEEAFPETGNDDGELETGEEGEGEADQELGDTSKEMDESAENIFGDEKIVMPDDLASLYSTSSRGLSSIHSNREEPYIPESIPDSATTTLPSTETPKISPHLAAFLAFWVSMCHYTDPFGPQNSIRRAFKSVLQEWDTPSTRTQQCTELNDYDFPSGFNGGIPVGLPPVGGPHVVMPIRLAPGSIASSFEPGRGPGLKKGEFCVWVKQRGRKAMLRRILPWLQLRTVLMYHYLLCYEDSSGLAVRQSIEPLARVA